MTVSNSVTVANAKLDQEETTIGAAPLLRAYNGTMPATADTALSGNTLLASGALPSDWMSAASGKVKAKLGTWTLTGQAGAGAGTPATFFRLYDSAGTNCHKQGTLGAAVAIATNALSAANSNVLNFASTTGVAVGQLISGTGIVANSTVLAFTGTTVTMSQASTAGVANAASITFGYDMTIDNNSIANAQSINVSTFSITAGN
jgi:hypothetical protein